MIISKMRTTATFFRSLVLLLLLNLLVKPLWILVIDRKVQLLLGASEYGPYFSAYGFVFIGSTLADVGITSYVQRWVAYRGGIDAKLLRRLLGYKLLLSLCAAVLMMVVGIVAGVAHGGMLLSLILLHLLWSWISFGRALLSGMQLYGADAWISVSDKLMLVLLGVFLFYLIGWDKINLSHFLTAQIITSLITLLLAAIIFMRFLPGRSLQAADDVTLAALIKAGFPYALLFFLMSVHLRADAVLLGLLATHAQEAAYYATMFRFVDAAHMVASLAGGYLVAFWARHLHQATILRQSFHRIFVIMLSVGMATAVTAVFFGDTLYHFFYGDGYAKGGWLMRIGLPVVLPNFMVAALGTMLTAQGNIRQFVLLVVMAVLVNLTLNIVFIPRYGALGAAGVAIISQSVLAIMLWRKVMHQYQLNISRSYLQTFLLQTIIMLLAAWILYGLLHSHLLAILLLLFIWIGTLFLFRPFGLSAYIRKLH